MTVGDAITWSGGFAAFLIASFTLVLQDKTSQALIHSWVSNKVIEASYLETISSISNALRKKLGSWYSLRSINLFLAISFSYAFLSFVFSWSQGMDASIGGARLFRENVSIEHYSIISISIIFCIATYSLWNSEKIVKNLLGHLRFIESKQTGLLLNVFQIFLIAVLTLVLSLYISGDALFACLVAALSAYVSKFGVVYRITAIVGIAFSPILFLGFFGMGETAIILILFYFILTPINACFDVASFGFSRWVLDSITKFKADHVHVVLMLVLDTGFAVLLLTAVFYALDLGVLVANITASRFDTIPMIDVKGLFEPATKGFSGESFFVFVMLLSTVVPTFCHVFLAAILAAVRVFPGKARLLATLEKHTLSQVEVFVAALTLSFVVVWSVVFFLGFLAAMYLAIVEILIPYISSLTLYFSV